MQGHCLGIRGRPNGGAADGDGFIVGGECAVSEIDGGWTPSVESGEDTRRGLPEIVKLAKIALLRRAFGGRIP